VECAISSTGARWPLNSVVLPKKGPSPFFYSAHTTLKVEKDVRTGCPAGHDDWRNTFAMYGSASLGRKRKQPRQSSFFDAVKKESLSDSFFFPQPVEAST
jgi:hypothetical protein